MDKVDVIVFTKSPIPAVIEGLEKQYLEPFLSELKHPKVPPYAVIKFELSEIHINSSEVQYVSVKEAKNG